jgi:hypothetical protein
MFRSIRLRWLVAAAVVLIAVAIALSWRAGQPNTPAVERETATAEPKLVEPSSQPQETPTNTKKFVTSAACKECHASQFEKWHDSYHRTMTQVATPETIIPSIDVVQLHARGRDYKLERHGDTFLATLVSPEWESQMVAKGAALESIPNAPRTTREVLMTTGSHHMQTYWIRGVDGLRHFPWFFLPQEQQWVTREDVLLRPPDAAPLLPLWNVNCIKCHAVGGVPGFNSRSGFDTQVAELGISCEACHGPAELHVQFHRQKDSATPSLVEPSEASLVNPAECSPKIASEICGQCHSSTKLIDTRDWLVNGMRYRAAEDFQKQYKLIRFTDEEFKDDPYVRDGFWSDGSNRTAGDELLGMVESQCYQRGEMSCLSCHSMHSYLDRSDQLKPGSESNEACLQCHESFLDRISEHTHHLAESSGSSCYNCHMPHTSFGLLKSIRSHRIDSPSVATTLQSGRPNACNLCHLDKTLEWTANWMSQWYDAPAVTLSDEQQRISANVLQLLRGDAVQRGIAAWHMGWEPGHQVSGDDWQAPFLAPLLEDPYSSVRIVGSRALKKLPGFDGFSYQLVSTEEERREARSRALQKWQQQADGRTSEPREEILLGPNGSLLRDQLDRLLKQRDDRPIEIPE